MAMQSRLATEGDELAAHRFASGSVGLVSAADLECWRGSRPEGAWACFKSLFRTCVDPAPVVCIAPGARLRVHDIPKWIRDSYSVDQNETVTFTQISAEANRYRDAIMFENRRTMLVQHLHEAQRLDVLCLPSDFDRVQPEEEFPRVVA